MALFKISKGNSENLPSKETSWGNGYAWFTQDDGKFYIDYYDGDDSITPLDVTKKIRQPLNAYKADRDRLGNQLDTYYAHSLTLDDTNHKLVLKAYGTTVLSNVNTAEVSTGALGIDDSPTPGSINLVTSGGISTALSNKQNKILVDGILEGDGTGNISAADTLSGSFLNLDTSINEYSQNNPVTSAAVYNFVTSSLGSLSGAMHFKGTTTTTMTDGRTTAAVIINGSSYPPEAGDVVIYSDSEYVWTGSAWERLGRDSSFKVQQSTVDSGTVATNKWASRIEQNANGEITVTMATLDTSGTWSGTATTASKLSNTSKVGDTNKPVYFTANGVPAAINYTIDKSVPSTAVFTDTATAADNILDGSNSGTQITYAPYSSKQATASLYTGTTNPTLTTRLNYDGYLYATKLYSNGTEVLTSHQSVVNNNISVTWDTETTIATIGSTPIKIKIPANTSTDTLVKQTSKTNNVEYKILTTTSASPTSGSAAEAAYDTEITINPSTHTLTNNFIKAQKGLYSHITSAPNINGYVKFATLTPNATYVNRGFQISYVARGSTGGVLYCIFSNVNNTDPVLTVTKTGPDEFYYKKSDTSTWDLYIYKPSTYGQAVFSIINAGQLIPTNFLTWTDDHVTELPEDCSTAAIHTIALNINGTATKATQDSDGNAINTTYIKKSILSGAYDIMYSSAANTPTRLAANTTSTKKFLRMTGTGSAGTAPVWDTVTNSDVGLSNVTNHQQVHEVAWDSTNKKITRSKNGSAGDVVQFVAGTNITLTAAAGTLTITGTNTDTLVKQTSKTDSVEYKILMGSNSSPTSGTAYEAVYDANITINPSTHTITATNFAGNASSATKLGSTTVGGSTQPIYLSNGTATTCSTYAGGTAVTLNGTSKAASTASFYAPTGAGTSGQILQSNGSGAPSWVNMPDTSAFKAYKATNSVELPILLINGSASQTTTNPSISTSVNAYGAIPNSNAPTVNSSTGALTINSTTNLRDKIILRKSYNYDTVMPAESAATTGELFFTSEVSGNGISFAPTSDKIYMLGIKSATDDNFYYNENVYAQNNVLYGAAWNDYAEYRESFDIEPGRVIIELGNGRLIRSTERLQAGAEVISDTYGFIIGKGNPRCSTPVAVSGRVLVFTYEDRHSYSAGDAVCSGPNGTVSKMTREEIKEYPERIIGTVSEIPEYEFWGENNIKVNNRIWIRMR